MSTKLENPIFHYDVQPVLDPFLFLVTTGETTEITLCQCVCVVVVVMVVVGGHPLKYIFHGFPNIETLNA